MKLYELEERLNLIESLLLEDNPDILTSEDYVKSLESAKEEVLQEIESKLSDYLDWRGELKSRIDFLKSEKKRLDSKIQDTEKKISWIDRAVENNLTRTGKRKDIIGTYDVGYRKNPPSVVITDEYLIPGNFKIANTEVSIDKKGLKDAMTDGKFVIDFNGELIEVAHLEQKETLYIK